MDQSVSQLFPELQALRSGQVPQVKLSWNLHAGKAIRGVWFGSRDVRRQPTLLPRPCARAEWTVKPWKLWDYLGFLRIKKKKYVWQLPVRFVLFPFPSNQREFCNREVMDNRLETSPDTLNLVRSEGFELIMCSKRRICIIYPGTEAPTRWLES